jgi:hypothetical protein
VTVSQGFCLGGITERKAAEAAQTIAEAGVALVTHGAGGLTMPPIEMLRGAGVLVFAGNDDIRDTWSPYGTGDLLLFLRLCGASRYCTGYGCRE